MNTKLAKNVPFPGKPAPKPRKHQSVDTAGVIKCRDPYAPDRVINTHKWDTLFEGVKEGDCFRATDGSETTLSAISRALRMYLKRNGVEGIVRQQAKTHDGIGRVWLVKVVKDDRTAP